MPLQNPVDVLRVPTYRYLPTTTIPLFGGLADKIIVADRYTHITSVSSYGIPEQDTILVIRSVGKDSTLVAITAR